MILLPSASFIVMLSGRENFSDPVMPRLTPNPTTYIVQANSLYSLGPPSWSDDSNPEFPLSLYATKCITVIESWTVDAYISSYNTTRGQIQNAVHGNSSETLHVDIFMAYLFDGLSFFSMTTDDNDRGQGTRSPLWKISCGVDSNLKHHRYQSMGSQPAENCYHLHHRFQFHHLQLYGNGPAASGVLNHSGEQRRGHGRDPDASNSKCTSPPLPHSLPLPHLHQQRQHQHRQQHQQQHQTTITSTSTSTSTSSPPPSPPSPRHQIFTTTIIATITATTIVSATNMGATNMGATILGATATIIIITHQLKAHELHAV
ncbi:MAG: hypothetical protein BYD32DRAFT_435234 [Podila humilis]|nr:MAG: hypothetical protein BYD32DRAFT_435234 [Podila humilis]